MSFLTDSNSVTIPKSQQIDINKLTIYLRNNVEIFPKTGNISLSKFGFGQSNPTYLLHCDNTKYVLRKKPPGKLLPSAHAVEREYRVMSALQSTKVPVPKTYHLCTDSAVIGTPFYLCEFIDGKVYPSGELPNCSKHQRYAMYNEYCRVLAEIHSVNTNALGLKDFGGSGLYLKRNKNAMKNAKVKSINIYDHCARLRSIWNRQFQRAETEEVSKMKNVHEFFKQMNDYTMKDNNEIETLVHGDYHFANLIWHKTQARILAVVDWELSTIGNPMNDLATCALIWYYPSSGIGSKLRGVNGLDPKSLGIPTEFEFVKAYFKKLSVNSAFTKKIEFPIKDWNYYVSLQLHRYIGVFQGIYKRNKIGTSSNPSKLPIIALNEYLAKLGLNALNQTDIYNRILSSTNQEILPLHLTSFDSFLSDKFYKIYRNLLYFMDAFIYPNEKKYSIWISENNIQFKETFPLFPMLQSKAKELGLWNMYLHLTNFEYASICEVLGTSLSLAPTATNCAAPDVPNVYVLKKYGSEAQKKKWLQPLLDAEFSSCYGMTEPNVASSDARNIECSIIKSNDGLHYVINGRKWWTTNASHPQCKFIILMGKTDPSKSGQSMVIVPMNAKGIRVVRQLTTYGYNDGHAEIVFDNVRVNVKESLLGNEGDGFVCAQVRLSPARVHHCMRFIGMTEVAINLMKNRVLTRYAFGSMIGKFTSIENDIANSREELEKCRLLVLQAALMMDLKGIKDYDTRQYISMIKVAVCNMGCTVMDRAIQIFGGMGVCQDTVLPYFYVQCRNLRIGDGPDAVHHRVISRIELKNSKL